MDSDIPTPLPRASYLNKPTSELSVFLPETQNAKQFCYIWSLFTKDLVPSGCSLLYINEKILFKPGKLGSNSLL